jgi:hypothetical protein
MVLYWNDEGTVACEAHAPKRGGRVWRSERWRRPSKAVADALSCDSCAKERRPRPTTGRFSRAAPSRTEATDVVVALPVGLSCDLCGGRADRVLIDDPEQLPACFAPENIAARLGCGPCDDGMWSRAYPLEAADAPGARSLAIARRRAEMRGQVEPAQAMAA